MNTFKYQPYSVSDMFMFGALFQMPVIMVFCFGLIVQNISIGVDTSHSNLFSPRLLDVVLANFGVLFEAFRHREVFRGFRPRPDRAFRLGLCSARSDDMVVMLMGQNDPIELDAF